MVVNSSTETNPIMFHFKQIITKSWILFRIDDENRPKAGFPLGGILRAERNFSLSCDFSGGTN